MNAPVRTPQGPVVALGVPDVQDYPRLVYVAPYFTTVPMAELFAPAVQEAVEAILPTVIPPFVDDAAQAAVNQYAVLLTGSVMTGPLILSPGMPSVPSQAANKAYVDAMLSTAGIPEVPPVPLGQVWGRETGQWVAIDTSGGGDALPLAGGTMAGPINMSGNQIRGLPTVPVQPDGAASAGWVLQQLAAVSLYQGTWNPATNVPDLTQPIAHQNAYTWICNPVATGGVVVTAAIPGLQGVTVYDGDTVIFSAQTGTFTAIHAGGLSLTEADARYLQLTGGQMEGALLLNAAPTQPMQAANMAWVQSLLTGAGIPEAPSDGQSYLRTGSSSSWTPGVPVSGGVMTGPLMLSGAATTNLQAVAYGQVMNVIPPVANPNTVWAGPLSAPAAAPAFRTLSAADIGGGVLPVIRGGTGQVAYTNGLLQVTGNVFSSIAMPLPVANGGTGASGITAGIVTSSGGALSSVPLPLGVAYGGTGNTTGAPAAMPMGVIDGSNAAAGQVGEFVTSTPWPGGGFIGGGSGFYNIASINLGAGDWTLEAIGTIAPPGTFGIPSTAFQLVSVVGGVNTTLAINYVANINISPGNNWSFPMPGVRFNTAAAGIVYLQAAQNSTADINTGGSGWITARRTR